MIFFFFTIVLKSKKYAVKSITAAGFLFFVSVCCRPGSRNEDIAIRFDGGYGQLEIGGKYAGAEFHQSRPLPSRISFYYPVANSIDLSTSYWSRQESVPFTVILSIDGKKDTLGLNPQAYRYTPYYAAFEQWVGQLRVTYQYDFCAKSPVMVFQLWLTNESQRTREIKVQTLLNAVLRTSHTYSMRNPASVEYDKIRSTAYVFFDDADTDSALVFVANAGEIPLQNTNDRISDGDDATNGAVISFTYQQTVESAEQMNVVQLIGSCVQSEKSRVTSEAVRDWQRDVEETRHRLLNYSTKRSTFKVPDSDLQQTLYWAKAMMASNMHYLHGWIVPMPCPAEYNFFFTHDFLVTSLGAGLFDSKYVTNGYRFLSALAREDSVLPHAYYWKDDGYRTETCSSDNWNHLWFILSVNAYLKHTADVETVNMLYPILQKSIHLLLKNKGADDLMYAFRPDWWDIGHVYGARVYITTLMIRALQDYAVIAGELGRTDEELDFYYDLVEKMNKSLVMILWDDNCGYLMNRMDGQSWDPHYYAGSLVASFVDVLDLYERQRLIGTAQKILLDENIGIRNAMPADFHQLNDVYKFKETEVGIPYGYMNGGVWTHGTAWYVLGLLSINQPDEAREALKTYLTLGGIEASPMGQPALYEYRIADAASKRYGEIDKPNFLWAAGWYIYSLYQLAGVRENSWNISFCPNLPKGFYDLEYDLMSMGKNVHVRCQGKGKFFRQIMIDGKRVHSAVVYKSGETILLKRGYPVEPYLAEATCRIENVRYRSNEASFLVDITGSQGQPIRLKIISPKKVQRIIVDDVALYESISQPEEDGVFISSLKTRMVNEKKSVVFQF